MVTPLAVGGVFKIFNRADSTAVPVSVPVVATGVTSKVRNLPTSPKTVVYVGDVPKTVAVPPVAAS